MPSSRQAALIRGINVGRAKRVAMADLRAVIEDFGYTNVRTLLNSGNVVFNAAKDSPAVAAGRIEKALVLRLNVEARVVVLAEAEVVKVVAENTLLHVATDPSRLMVAILFDISDRAKLVPMLAEDWDEDVVALGKRAAYLWCSGGILESRLLKSVNRALKDAVTTRNWSTMLKLKELLAKKG